MTEFALPPSLAIQAIVQGFLLTSSQIAMSIVTEQADSERAAHSVSQCVSETAQMLMETFGSNEQQVADWFASDKTAFRNRNAQGALSSICLMLEVSFYNLVDHAIQFASGKSTQDVYSEIVEAIKRLLCREMQGALENG